MADKSLIVLGPTLDFTLSPGRLAHGPVRNADDITKLRADADRLDALFFATPRLDWCVAAQAAMGMNYD